MRRAECPWTSVLCLTMLPNYTGWKNITSVWNCSNEGDEMYLRSVTDKCALLLTRCKSGSFKFGGSIYKTSFKSGCLARGKRTPTNLWRMNSQVHNLLLIRFTLSAINVSLTVFPLCSVSCLEIQFLSIYFFSHGSSMQVTVCGNRVITQLWDKSEHDKSADFHGSESSLLTQWGSETDPFKDRQMLRNWCTTEFAPL